MGVITQTITTAGTTNWVAPAGTTTVQVELWGGGGTGGPSTGAASGAGGGAGGQYAIQQVAVTPGNTYAVVVAAAKTSATTVGNGNDSTFATTTVVAKGGVGGAAATGATSAGGAGSTTGGVGDTVFAGGSGATGVSSTSSGGGGSGAGSTGTGNSGSAGTGGAAKNDNGGAGGNGVTTANTRNAGGNYGGGGSGGLSSSATDRAGGNGAQGLAILTYTLADLSLTDNFATKDTGKWTWVNSADVSAGQLVLNAANGDSIASVGTYDFTGKAVYAELVQTPNAVAGGYTEFEIRSTVDATDCEMFLWFNDGNLYFRERVNNVNDQTSVTYNATDHRWVRLSEGGGSVYWETAPDATGPWTLRRSKVKGAVDLTSAKMRINVNTGAGAGFALWDNFNTTPSTATSLAPPVRRPNYGSLIQM